MYILYTVRICYKLYILLEICYKLYKLYIYIYVYIYI